MKIKTTFNPAGWLCALFILDCAMMPVVKIMGLSYKFSYMVAFLTVAYMLLMKLKEIPLLRGDIRKVSLSLILCTCFLCFGELWAMAFFGVSLNTTFLKIVIGYILMIGALYYGYVCRVKIADVVYWGFIGNVVINCVLSLLGREVPAFLAKLYSISLETYIDGYYRNGGIMGNPNSSLLITNIILLFIVVLYKHDRIKLSNFRLASLYILSIAADVIVSSRGELLHTALILAYLTYLVFKKTKSAGKMLLRIGIVAVLIVLIVTMFWGVLVEEFPAITTSVERMLSLEDLFDSSSDTAETDSIFRPFLRVGDFINRFRYSPFWGTGVDGGGSNPDFVKGTTGYHNDYFFVLGSAGILGFAMWFRIVRIAVKRVGLCMLAPLTITALSNTFVRSYFGTMLYFFIIGYVLYIQDAERKSLKKQAVSEMPDGSEADGKAIL